MPLSRLKPEYADAAVLSSARLPDAARQGEAVEALGKCISPERQSAKSNGGHLPASMTDAKAGCVQALESRPLIRQGVPRETRTERRGGMLPRSKACPWEKCLFPGCSVPSCLLLACSGPWGVRWRHLGEWPGTPRQAEQEAVAKVPQESGGGGAGEPLRGRVGASLGEEQQAPGSTVIRKVAPLSQCPAT